MHEEYAASYDDIKQELAEISRSSPSWMTFERGIEALSHSVVPIVNREGNGKKGLTIEDLLIKVSSPWVLNHGADICVSLFNAYANIR